MTAGGRTSPAVPVPGVGKRAKLRPLTMREPMDAKRNDLTARNFPTAEEDAQAALRASRYAGPDSAYRLAFTDVEFLLQDELRPVRMQLELLKPEMVQKRLGIESTIVIFGSARIPPPEMSEKLLAQARAEGDTLAIRRA